MPLFRYEALDQTGNKVVGAMDAADETVLHARLTQQGYRPVQVHAAPARGGAASREPEGSPLTADEWQVARMLHQLWIAFRAGMPAFQALTTVAGQVPEGNLRRVLTELAREVQAGRPLSDAMAGFPRVFTRGDVGMVRAGEAAGFLPEALGYLAVQHEEDENTRRRLRIWRWFFHVQMLAFFAIIPAAIWLKEAIPALDAVAGLGPALRAFLFFTLPVSLLYLTGIVWFGKARRRPSLARIWHGWLLRLPVARPIQLLRARAVLARTLQQITQGNVSAATAWETAAAAIPNLALGDRVMEALPAVRSTGQLTAGLQACGLMDPADIGMVATGEATGSTPEALEYLANHYEGETKRALGASVVRGAVTFTLYGFLLGGVALAFVAWCYGQGALGILNE